MPVQEREITVEELNNDTTDFEDGRGGDQGAREAEEQAIMSGAGNIDQVDGDDDDGDKPDPEDAAIQPDDDLGSVLFGDGKPKHWKFGPENNPGAQIECIQTELGFFAKQEVIGIVGQMLDEAMSGPRALTLQSLFEVPPEIRARMQVDPASVSVNDFRDADTFVQAVGKLVSYVPRYTPELYAIILGVPEWDRDRAMDILRLPAERGGLSDDQGEEILHIFLEQNYRGLNRFFREFLVGVRGKLRHLQGETEEETTLPSPSKRSRRTQRRTRSR